MKRFLHEFSRYGDGSVVDNGWWEIVGENLYNMCGGYHPYVPHPDDIIAEAKDFESLDWSYLIEPDSLYGWIDVEGKFYGCSYRHHGFFAQYYFKASERELEEAGYIRVYRSYPDCAPSWYCEGNHITKKQQDCLIERGLYVACYVEVES